MNPILLAVLIVTVIGLIGAVILVAASIFMYVPVDERVEQITGCLPGANCGACGCAGCADYAKSIVEDGNAINKCTPGGAKSVAAIAEIMGVEATASEPMKAVVTCSGTCDKTSKRYEFDGIHSCQAVKGLYGGDGLCKFGCLGYGDCTRACAFDAIHIVDGIAKVDREKCTGCGACAAACHEGAIAMVDGKARLMRDDYCDGLGDCLPTCPTGAITFVEREAAAYDEKAVMENKQRKMRKEGMTLSCGCPGSQSRDIQRQDAPAVETPQAQQTSCLSQWPVQIKLVPVNAPYFDGARLLIAADCTAYAYAAFHERFIKGHITLVGCPKLDSVDYSEKLTEIIRENDIRSVTVVRMEVPCCGGLELAVKKALQASGKFIPWQVVTLSVDGRVLD